MMLAMIGTTQITITENELISKIALPNGSEQVQKETYKIDSEKGNVIEITSTNKAGKETPGSITVLSDDSLEVTTKDPMTPFKTLYLIK